MVLILEVNPHEVDIQRDILDVQELVRGGITVKPHIQRFVDDLEAHLGVTLSAGTYNGHSPPEGPTQAVDIFNTDNAAGYALQDRICDFARKNAKRYGVRYCIRRRQIWNIERDAEGFRNQAVQGNRTADHYDHTHLTFYATAPGPFGPTPSPTPTPTPTPTMKELRNMDFTYIYNGEDWCFLASVRYFGKLPFGATLDGLKHHGLLKNLGGANAEFHRGVVALADAAGFRGIG